MQHFFMHMYMLAGQFPVLLHRRSFSPFLGYHISRCISIAIKINCNFYMTHYPHTRPISPNRRISCTIRIAGGSFALLCADILIYLSKFVKKKLYEFYLWCPPHDCWHKHPQHHPLHHPPPSAPQVLAYHVTDYFRQIYTRKII